MLEIGTCMELTVDDSEALGHGPQRERDRGAILEVTRSKNNSDS